MEEIEDKWTPYPTIFTDLLPNFPAEVYMTSDSFDRSLPAPRAKSCDAVRASEIWA
jgi:hypothetical protein